MRKIMIAGAIVGMLSSACQAQDVFNWPAPPRSDGPTQFRYFPMGTPLVLRTTTQVSTKDSKSGDRIYLEVAEPLTFRGQVVVPAGSPAVGEVVRSDRNGHFGKKGKIDIRLLYVQTPFGRFRINGHDSDEGTSGTITSFATIAFISPLGFLIHGTSAHIPFGSTVKAYLAEPLRFVEQPPAPALATVQPDSSAAPLPASFDPSVFGGQKTASAR